MNWKKSALVVVAVVAAFFLLRRRAPTADVPQPYEGRGVALPTIATTLADVPQRYDGRGVALPTLPKETGNYTFNYVLDGLGAAPQVNVNLGNPWAIRNGEFQYMPLFGLIPQS